MRQKVAFTMFFFALTISAGTIINFSTLPLQTYAGHYVGPMPALLDGETMQVVCNDYLHSTYVPSTFEVDVSTIPGLDARWPDVVSYERAAILMWAMAQQENSGQTGSIQFAIWNLFAPSAPDPEGTAYWSTWVQGQNIAEYYYDDVAILTPTAAYRSNQEFLAGAAAPVPEPAMLALTGIFLIGLRAVKSRFNRRT
jgi:hypothetical protein